LVNSVNVLNVSKHTDDNQKCNVDVWGKNAKKYTAHFLRI